MASPLLKKLKQEDVISSLDVHLATFFSELSDTEDEDIQLSIALLSNGISRGDVCLDLEAIAGKPLYEIEERIPCPELDVWVEKLQSLPLVGQPGVLKPLILDGKNRLYLYRYWEYEYKLAQSIRERLDMDVDSNAFNRISEKLNLFFPSRDTAHLNQQKLAVLMPSLKRFSVITGGPGTGKTTLVAKMLALLIDLFSPQKLEIYLAAPTGKAATGLRESIQKAKETLNCDEAVRSLIPEETYTIHRLLGSVSGSPYFKYNENNKIPADILVVDEASMIDLPLMSKLMQATAAQTRLILMGDKDQLASVASGTVFGDICHYETGAGYSGEFYHRMKRLDVHTLLDHHTIEDKPSDLRDSIVMLEKSYRFSTSRGIGAFSLSVNQGQADVAMNLLKKATDEEVVWRNTKSHQDIFQQLFQQIIDGYAAYLRSNNPNEALLLFNQFQIICAVRKGPFGVEAINLFAEMALRKEGLIQPTSQWYAGRPILITRNHYGLQLFNGDMGILMTDLTSDRNEVSACFPDRAGEFRRISPHRLPEHETAFAITVHKSQGSEFEQVHLILPDGDTPLLTRELLYTGITRAKKKVWVWADESVLRTTISRKIQRSSGLRDALWEH